MYFYIISQHFKFVKSFSKTVTGRTIPNVSSNRLTQSLTINGLLSYNMPMIITDEKKECFTNESLFMNISGPSGVFLDIETTGLKKESSSIYLIGLAFHNDDEQAGLREILIFAESPDEERDILLEFNRFISKEFHGKERFITYNGHSFDLPFLKLRSEKQGIAPLDTLSDGSDIDLYKLIRPYKNVFSLNRLGQKDIEDFLMIKREDKHSGGELISVYYEYVETGDKILLDLLLTHNREDVLGMLEILSIFSYIDIFKEADSGRMMDSSEFSISRAYTEKHTGFDGLENEQLILEFSIPRSVPHPRLFHSGALFLSVSGNAGKLTIPLYTGKLKHYFENYKDYCYIPSEDRAILKTLGKLMKSEETVKATAETCYIKASGTFLPLPWNFCFPEQDIYRNELKKGQSFVFYKESLLTSPSLKDYLIKTIAGFIS